MGSKIEELSDDIMTIAEYAGNDLEGFSRFLQAAEMCGYTLVRNGEHLTTKDKAISELCAALNAALLMGDLPPAQEKQTQQLLTKYGDAK